MTITIHVPWVLAGLALLFGFLALRDYLAGDGRLSIAGRVRLRIGLILAAIAAYLLLT